MKIVILVNLNLDVLGFNFWGDDKTGASQGYFG